MNATKRKKWLVAGALVAYLVALLVPFETTVVPEWKLRDGDQSGNSMQGYLVRESWCHYTLETDGSRRRTT